MTPRPYQIEGSYFLADRRCALLADQMRVGKSPQAIMGCDIIAAERVLITCPAIARYQWARQWGDWSGRESAVILEDDVRSLSDFRGVMIMSYNRALTNRAALLAPPKWDVFIPDEAHFAKTPTAQRTSLVYGRNGVGWNSDRLWALTGTPAPNHAGEMWAMLRAFGIVKASYEDFIRYFCIYDEVKGRFHGNKTEHLPELRALIAPVTLRRTLAEVAPHLPRIGYNFFVVKPGEGVVDLPTDDESQIKDIDRITVAMAKIPTLVEEIVECITSREYDQTVVYGYHVEPLQELVAALNERRIGAATMTGRDSDRKRENVQKEFKSGALPVVAAQIIAAGTAIDLSAASHAYFLELDYVPDNNAQAAHRLVNIEKGAPVTCDILTWPGTQDDKVQRRIIRKVETAVFKS